MYRTVTISTKIRLTWVPSSETLLRSPGPETVDWTLTALRVGQTVFIKWFKITDTPRGYLKGPTYTITVRVPVVLFKPIDTSLTALPWCQKRVRGRLGATENLTYTTKNCGDGVRVFICVRRRIGSDGILDPEWNEEDHLSLSFPCVTTGKLNDSRLLLRPFVNQGKYTNNS